jgi:dihydrofolate reductase
MKPRISFIAALSENRVIGREGRLPWHLPDDWVNFKKVTAGHPFVMGRKSYDTPDGLYSDVFNIVLTSRLDLPLLAPSTHFVAQIDQIWPLLDSFSEVFVLGGGEIFEAMMPLADRLYLTEVHAQFEGDAFFPAFDKTAWHLTEDVFHDIDCRHAYSFSLRVYDRRASRP